MAVRAQPISILPHRIHGDFQQMLHARRQGTIAAHNNENAASMPAREFEEQRSNDCFVL
jgi:hypothetical protein